MTIATFIPDDPTSEYALAVVNRTEPRPLQTLLETLFADQPVTVDERRLPDAERDTVVLLEDGDVVATSPLAALERTILMVNSDLYVTGTRTLDVDVPAVLEHLQDVPFELRGYPASNKEKLLLIAVSRHVERRAYETGAGTLRASFQRLSRIDDERGTRAVYERLAETDVDTHVYGVPDRTPPASLDVTVHGGHTENFRRAWFVVYTPPRADDDAAALVAYERDAGKWSGFWTYGRDRVAAVDEYVDRTM
ncbi:MAG: DICT sensory domain-containing protein [Haloarculaceae archaeon]